MKAFPVVVWYFRSETNPSKTFETLGWSDQSTSCNCNGWTKRVHPLYGRTCKHTRSVAAGTAGPGKSLIKAAKQAQPAEKQEQQSERVFDLSI